MTKLPKCVYPNGLGRDNFTCHGPVATKDTEFQGCKLADLGCFKQEGVDSNKYVHCAVVNDAKGNWYLYSEWGRTTNGSSNKPQFQFLPCLNEQHAMTEFVKKCDSKNTKRGKWEKVGSKDRYVPKGKDDLYTVRVLASRSVGLTDARNIANQDAIQNSVVDKPTKKKKSSLDSQTMKLFRDLLGGTIQYARSTLVGGTIPAQTAIDEARDLLQDAQRQLVVVGNDLKSQVQDSVLRQLTYTLYGMIPKVKAQGVPETDWILSQENVSGWQQDLDAFESALKTGKIEEKDDDIDVMRGIPADVSWVDPRSELGEWLYSWWIKATRNRHNIGSLKIHGVWSVNRHGDLDIIRKNQQIIQKEMTPKFEKPLHQDKKRPDLNGDSKLFEATNTALLFHGSKSVNVTGIIREGFRFPNELVGVILTAQMFGNGTYMADDYKKSCGYCSSPNSYYGGGGSVKGRHSFMFAVDTILGVPHIAPGAKGYTSPPTGTHSVFGKSGHTSSWGGTLQNNEFIIYKKGRSNLRYLAEVSW